MLPIRRQSMCREIREGVTRCDVDDHASFPTPRRFSWVPCRLSLAARPPRKWPPTFKSRTLRASRIPPLHGIWRAPSSRHCGLAGDKEAGHARAQG